MPDQPNRSNSGASGVRDFAARTKLLLNDSERQYMYAILREYRTYKQLDALVLCLRSVLDTPVKMDLLKDIRRFVDASQLSKYDELVPYHKMAHPWPKESTVELNSKWKIRSGDRSLTEPTDSQLLKTAAKGADVLVHPRTDSRSSRPRTSSRKMVRLYRDPNKPLDFEISHGLEDDRGIFVSKVKNHSSPDRAGLQMDDQILEVNGVSFDHISLRSALDVLTKAPKLTMLVQTSGQQAARKSDSEKILWYDVEEKCLVADAFMEHDFLKLFKANSRVYRKVSIHVQRGRRYLGFNIRGGSEYDLGIYISRVDPGGLGEQRGIRVGDRLMVVNGVSFNNISHFDAVKLLRSQKRLFLILLFVGFYPVCKEILDEHSELDTVSTLPKVEKALLEVTGHGRRKKSGSRFMEDTRVDHVWRSLSDGELWAEEDSDDEELSIASLPLRRWEMEEEEAVPVHRIGSNHLHPHPVAGRRKSGNVFMVSRETASITPVYLGDRRQRGKLEASMLYDPDLDGALLREEKHSRKQRKMKKSRSLRDLSRSELKLTDVDEILSSDEYLNDKHQLALASLEVTAQRLGLLSEDEIQAIVRRTKQYLRDGDFEAYIQPLMAILDTRERQELLTDIRPLIRHQNLSTFDRWARPVARSRGNKDWSRNVNTDEHPVHEHNSPRSKTSQSSEVSWPGNNKRQLIFPSSSSFGQRGYEMPSSGRTYAFEKSDRKKSLASETNRHPSKGLKSRVGRSGMTPSQPLFLPSSSFAPHHGHRHSENEQLLEGQSSPETIDEIQPPDYFRDNDVSDSIGLPSGVDHKEWIQSMNIRQQSMIDKPWHLGKEAHRGGKGRFRVIDQGDSGRGNREDFRGRQSAVDLREKRKEEFGRRHSNVDLHNDSFSRPRSKGNENHEDSREPRSRVDLRNEDHEEFSDPRSRAELRNEDHEDFESLDLHNKHRKDLTRLQSETRKGVQDLRPLSDKGNEWKADGRERGKLNAEIANYRRNDSSDVELPDQRFHRWEVGHEVGSKANHTGNWSGAEGHDTKRSPAAGNQASASVQTSDKNEVQGLRRTSNSAFKQSQFWNWNGENERGYSEIDNAAYRTDSVTSVNSALQLLDRVLRSEDSDVQPSHPRQPLTLPTNSKRSSRSASPDSDVASYSSNLTSRRGSYDVTVPSVRSSVSQNNQKHTRSLSKSSSSRFVDSGVASDFRNSTPVLAGFSLHRDEQALPFHDDNSGVSLTSIRHLGDEYSDHRSTLSHTNLSNGHRSRPDLNSSKPFESHSNQRPSLFSSQDQGANQSRPSVFPGNALPLAFNVQKRAYKERQMSPENREEPITVYLDKSFENLGLSISGGSDSRSQPNIMIENVIPGSAADLEGTLKPGMHVLSIDDVSLKSVTHQEAIKIIRVAFKDRSMPVMRIRVLP